MSLAFGGSTNKTITLNEVTVTGDFDEDGAKE